MSIESRIKYAQHTAPYWLVKHYKANITGVHAPIDRLYNYFYYTWSLVKLTTWSQLTEFMCDWGIPVIMKHLL